MNNRELTALDRFLVAVFKRYLEKPLISVMKVMIAAIDGLTRTIERPR